MERQNMKIPHYSNPIDLSINELKKNANNKLTYDHYAIQLEK